MRSAGGFICAVSAGIVVVIWGQEPKTSTPPFWDGVYSQNSRIFSHQPTELLKWAVKDRTPGKALDVGMGQGRNSIFLARQGWDVTGFDPSAEGIRQARAAAEEFQVRLNALVAREEDFDFGQKKWDLIVMTYVRLVNGKDAARIQRALRPGGIFVYENNNTGVPNDLLRAFLGFRVLHFEDTDAYTDWHPEKKQRVERLVAERTTK